VLLSEQQEREDFTTILEIIRECFSKALSRGQFLYTRKFLLQFHRIRRHYRDQGHWALAHLDDFLLAISRPAIMSALNRYLIRMRGDDPKRLRRMTQTLVQLSPECVESVGPMLQEAPSKQVQHELRKAVLQLSRQDYHPLARLVQNSAPEVAKQGVVILGRIEDESVLPIIQEASRSPEAPVRRGALHVLANRADVDPGQLPPFLSDPDPWIRRFVFRRLTQERNPEAEDALLSHLEQRRFTRKDDALLRSLYAALGRCGSDRSIPLLQQRLFSEPWRLSRVRALHRSGAAKALELLQLTEADGLLQKARRSYWPAIRIAARSGKEQSDVLEAADRV
jgi:hypothetical protein